MVVLVFGNVVLRYGFNSGIYGLRGALALALRLAHLPGRDASRLREHAHLGTDMLVGRLRPLGKKVCLRRRLRADAADRAGCSSTGALEQTKINWDVTGAVERRLDGRGSTASAWSSRVSAALVHAAPTSLQGCATGTMVSDAEDLVIVRAAEARVDDDPRLRRLAAAAMAIGIPIAFALLVCGVALMWHLALFDPQILAQNLIDGADSYPLLAVPFFMLAGEIMNVGGLSRRIVNFALALVGHIKGGLGYVTIIAGLSCWRRSSGSAVADAAALTALLLPMMVAAGHDKARSGGSDRVGRDHRAGHPAQHRVRRLRRRRQRLDLQALPRRRSCRRCCSAPRSGSPGAWLARNEDIASPPPRPVRGPRSPARRPQGPVGARCCR